MGGGLNAASSSAVGLEATATGACGRKQGPCEHGVRSPRAPYPGQREEPRGLVSRGVLPVPLPLPARLMFLPGRKLLLTLRFWR